jgi:hypothetical protein
MGKHSPKEEGNMNRNRFFSSIGKLVVTCALCGAINVSAKKHS